jgi:hypothetical protein
VWTIEAPLLGMGGWCWLRVGAAAGKGALKGPFMSMGSLPGYIIRDVTPRQVCGD